jgi:hypothetical protein
MVIKARCISLTPRKFLHDVRNEFKKDSFI